MLSASWDGSLVPKENHKAHNRQAEDQDVLQRPGRGVQRDAVLCKLLLQP